MAATKTATKQIKLGSFTKQITKAGDREPTIARAIELARSQHLVVVVKRDFAGRWQAFCKRRNPRGAAAPSEYDYSGDDRRAKRITLRHDGGVVYIADTASGVGSVEAEMIRF